MSQLAIYRDGEPPEPLGTTTEAAGIAAALKPLGVGFERWTADRELADEATQDEVIEAYRKPIDRLMKQHGFAAVDVISVDPDHPQKDELRAKFLDEHTHSDFEVRFFVDGAGLFCLHHEDRVYAVTCTRGDLISVPAGIRHWFDMGPLPRFRAIRLFTDEAGWVAQFTGDDIASRYPAFTEAA